MFVVVVVIAVFVVVIVLYFVVAVVTIAVFLFCFLFVFVILLLLLFPPPTPPPHPVYLFSCEVHMNKLTFCLFVCLLVLSSQIVMDKLTIVHSFFFIFLIRQNNLVEVTS